MKSELLSLTGLRFFAALTIVFHHLQGVLWLPAGSLSPFSLVAGVSFFFVLSGFVLYYSYHDRTNQTTWGEFAFLRFFRVWPAHIAVLVIIYFWLNKGSFEWLLPRISGLEFVSIILLFHSWSSDYFVYWGLNGPSWSISTELFFYFSFPLLLTILLRSTIGFVTGLLALTVLWLLYSSIILFDLNIKFHRLALGYINPLARLGEFGAGMLAAHLFVRQPTEGRKVSSFGWTTCEVAVIASIIYQNWRIREFSGWLDLHFGPVAVQWISSSSGFILFAIATWVFAKGNGWVSRVLSYRVFVWLGTISFATYLIHQPLIFFFQKKLDGSDIHVGLQIAAFVFLLLFLSAAIHSLVELPAMRVAKRFVHHRREKRARVRTHSQ